MMDNKQLEAYKKIQEGNKFGWERDLDTSDLLAKDDKGITLLEYAIKADLNISTYEDRYDNSLEILDILIRNGKESDVRYLSFDEETLFQNYNGTTLLEYLLKIDKCNSDNIRVIKNNTKVIELLLQYDEYKLSNLSDELVAQLTKRNPDGTYPLEQYIDNKVFIRNIIERINDPKIIIEIYNKYKNKNILRNINLDVALYRLPNGMTLFEQLVSNNIETDLERKAPNNKEIIDILIKYNKTEELAGISETVLTEYIEDNTTVLEYIINNSSVRNFTTYISDDKTIKLLEDLNILDKVSIQYYPPFFVDEQNLLGLQEGETTLDYLIKNNVNFQLTRWGDKECKKLIENGYLQALPKYITVKELVSIDCLELFLEKIKSGELDYNISDLGTYSTSMEDLAKFYITLAKLDMMMYVDELKEHDLLETNGDKMLIEELIKLDPDLLVTKILRKTQRETKIAAILKSHGIDIDTYNVAKNGSSVEEYRDEFTSTIGYGPIEEEGDILLAELESIFKNDGKSSTELIDLLVYGYRNGLIQSREICMSEIQNLIEIKKNNPGFVYIRDDEHGFFRPLTHEIHSDLSLDTIMHETGHALHEFLMGSSTPDGYEDLKRRLREDPATLERLIEFRKEIDRIEIASGEETAAIVDKVGVSKTENVEELLAADKEEKRKELEEILGYIDIDDETLDQVLGEMYTVEEFEAQKKKIIQRELRDQIIRANFTVYADISDIFDSIFQGKFQGGIIESPTGERIKGWYGHGIPYYSKESHGFDELVAEYASLLKSGNPRANLEILRKYIGEEMFEMISTYYYNNIVQKKYQVQTEEEEVEEDFIINEEVGRAR